MKHSGKPNLLHIEDNDDIALIVKRILSNITDLTRVRNLTEARELLAQNDYDLALLDLVLPDGSGLDLVAEIKQQKPQMLVIIHSAHEISETIHDVDAVMSKMHTQYDEMRTMVLELTGQANQKLSAQ